MIQKDFWLWSQRCLIFLGCSLILLVGCKNKTPPSPPKPVVIVSKVAMHQIPLVKEYIGITQSIASVAIRARVKGFLQQKNFIEGNPVKKDQLLFVIDQRPFKAQVELAQGQLARSIAQKQYQAVEYLRMKTLVEKGDVSKSRYDQVTAQYQESIAQVEIQRARLEEAEIDLGYCSMYSPFDGIIGHKYVDVGNLVGGTENTLLAYVVQLNPIYIEFSPSVNDFTEFLNYRQNMPFPVEAFFPHNKNLVFKGKMDLINNQADVPTSTILMRAIVENPEQLLLPGIYLNVQLQLATDKKSLLVPISATMETQGQISVYLVDKNNTVVSQTITIAGQFENNYIVQSGLNEGDQIIVNGLQQVKPGMQVLTKPINPQGKGTHG